MPVACRCGCLDVRGGHAHAIVDALAIDDLDTAMERGLLVIEPCTACSTACQEVLLSARNGRRVALAARERFRLRRARLERREQERATRRATPPTTDRKPSLPPAAAAALARARARAAGSKEP